MKTVICYEVVPHARPLVLFGERDSFNYDISLGRHIMDAINTGATVSKRFGRYYLDYGAAMPSRELETVTTKNLITDFEVEITDKYVRVKIQRLQREMTWHIYTLWRKDDRRIASLARVCRLVTTSRIKSASMFADSDTVVKTIIELVSQVDDLEEALSK